MESDAGRPTPSEALRAVELSRTSLSDRVSPGIGFLALLGATVAVSIALAGTGFARSDLGLVAAGAAVFAVVSGAQLWRVRRRTGVWVSDLAHRVVLGGDPMASGAFVVALLGSVWAASEEIWWAVALVAAAGGAAYALSGHRWLVAYRRSPGDHVGTGPGVVVALTAVVAVAGLLVLLAGA